MSQGVSDVGILLSPLESGNETEAGKRDASVCPEPQEGETHSDCFCAK